jgi:hypothetical protein
MGSKHKRLAKSIRISLWVALLLLLILGSSAIIAAAIQGKGENSAPSTDHVILRTATVGVSPTPSPTATSTPELAQTPLFYEDFLDNSKGWALTNSPDFTRALNDDKLTLAVINHNILTETVPSNTLFGDCTVDIRFTLLKADANDSVGVYVRGDGLLFHDYRIDIFGNNTIALSKEYLDADKKPQTLEFEKMAHVAALASVGKPNMLSIIMKGPYILLQVNGKTIKTMVDSDYTRGQIALFVNNGPTSDGVTAVFSSVKITEAPDQLPGLPISPTGTPVANQ